MQSDETSKIYDIGNHINNPYQPEDRAFTKIDYNGSDFNVNIRYASLRQTTMIKDLSPTLSFRAQR